MNTIQKVVNLPSDGKPNGLFFGSISQTNSLWNSLHDKLQEHNSLQIPNK